MQHRPKNPWRRSRRVDSASRSTSRNSRETAPTGGWMPAAALASTTCDRSGASSASSAPGSMPVSAARSTSPICSWCTLRLPGDLPGAEHAAGGLEHRHEHRRLVTGGDKCGVELDHLGGVVELGQRQARQCPRAGQGRNVVCSRRAGIDADPDRAGALIGGGQPPHDGCAGGVLGGGGDRVLEVHDDRVRPALEGPGQLVRRISWHVQIAPRRDALRLRRRRGAHSTTVSRRTRDLATTVRSTSLVPSPMLIRMASR